MSEATGRRSRLTPGVKAWLAAAAALSFVGFLAAAAYQPELSASSDRGAHALSRSPVGFAGLVRLLRADGVAVRTNSRDRPGATVDAEALLVLTPTPSTSVEAVRALARNRRVLLIAPKWLTAPEAQPAGRLTSMGRVPTSDTSAQLGALLPDGAKVVVSEDVDGARQVTVKAPRTWRDPHWRPSTLRPIEGLRFLAGGDLQPNFVDGRERTLIGMIPKGVSYLAADPDLFDNHALADPASARTAVSVIEELADGGPVVFDLTLPGVAGARSPLRLAFSPPFLPATAAALLLAAILGAMALDAFGAVRGQARAYAFGKRALVDTTASLFAVAGREPQLAGRYADLARASAVQALGLSTITDAAVADAALDRIGRERGPGPWSPLAAEAGAVASRAGLMDFARRLHRWRMEMMLGRG